MSESIFRTAQRLGAGPSIKGMPPFGKPSGPHQIQFWIVAIIGLIVAYFYYS